MSSYTGLKVGLELHCQLKTSHKLFCNCPAKLSLKEPEKRLLRRLRPTQSELGEVDPAALFEFQRGRVICYEAEQESTCLVEADEEPPHQLNREALETALIISLMLEAKPVEEVHVMRKVVIDGSNTTGFQRTAAIALNGKLNIAEKEIPILHVSLEEDAARKTGESGLTVNYRIDRLGIPLIEVATGPVIYTPEEAEKVAYGVGRVLKATGRVQRGLGTIRQDLNVSVKGGALIEIKGVQRLDLISKVVSLEFQRQQALLAIAEELKKRGIKADDLGEPVNVTEVFKETRCKVFSKALQEGGVVLAVKLPGFHGLLGRELIPGVRLGTEMSWRAMFYGGVGGLFHTDELPGYGISEDETRLLKQHLSLNELDAAVLVADQPHKAVDAIHAVVDRAREALNGVPEETRAAQEDGATRYMRPRPGSARMYPETDIPPIVIEEEMIQSLKATLPEKPEMVTARLMEKYGLNRKLSEQLLDSDYMPLFEEVASKTHVAPSYVATILTEILKSLERQGVPVNQLPDEYILEVFQLVDKGVTAKESVEPILEWLATHPTSNPTDAINALNLKMIEPDELEKQVDQVLKENVDLIKNLGKASAGKILGLVMRNLRGRVSPQQLLPIIEAKVEDYLKRQE
ncbi:MAG: Glu-tRNA(Gln) amidotransferase subunit GatE [Candidatus Bathyarchaeia archaeon]